MKLKLREWKRKYAPKLKPPPHNMVDLWDWRKVIMQIKNGDRVVRAQSEASQERLKRLGYRNLGGRATYLFEKMRKTTLKDIILFICWWFEDNKG